MSRAVQRADPGHPCSLRRPTLPGTHTASALDRRDVDDRCEQNYCRFVSYSFLNSDAQLSTWIHLDFGPVFSSRLDPESYVATRWAEQRIGSPFGARRWLSLSYWRASGRRRRKTGSRTVASFARRRDMLISGAQSLARRSSSTAEPPARAGPRERQRVLSRAMNQQKQTGGS